MLLQLFLLIFISTLAPTLYIEDGCTVKDKWEIDYQWTELDIGVYIPHEEISKLLTIDITFESKSFPLIFDSLDLSKTGVKFRRVREGQSTNKDFSFPVIHSRTWEDFVFEIDYNYGFMHLKTGEKMLMEVTVDYVPKSLIIQGSNITLNCNSNLRVFPVSVNPVFIPLENKERHELTFFSTKSFTTTLELEQRFFRMGWDNENLTMIPSRAQPLPPFEEHRLQLECHNSQRTTCDIKIGDSHTMAEDNIQLSKMPNSILVRSEKVDSFQTILQISPHTQDFPSMTENFHCPVKDEWKIAFVWNEIKIDAWISHEKQEQLDIQMDLEGHNFPYTYNIIKVFSDEIVLNRIRNGSLTNETFPFAPLKQWGWIEFTAVLDSLNGYFYLKTRNEVLVKSKTNYVPKSLTIKGSHVSVNCKSDSRSWAVEDKTVTLPLEDKEKHSLSFYSNKEFTVNLELEGRKFELGWDHGALTMIPAKIHPLPRFKEHHLELLCRKQTLICDIKIGVNYTFAEENIRLSSFPRSILVKGKNGNTFFVNIRVHSETIISKSLQSQLIGYIPIMYAAVATAIIIFLLICVCKMRKQSKKEKSDLDQNKENMDNQQHEMKPMVNSASSVERSPPTRIYIVSSRKQAARRFGRAT